MARDEPPALSSRRQRDSRRDRADRREKAIDDPLRLAADRRAAALPFESDRVERGTLHGRAAGVRVSFLEYRYPLLRPLREIEGLRLAAIEDIAAMKLSAVAQRGSKKDFIDVFALGRHFGLAEMLGFYRKKYGVEDEGHLLVALAYFDDADRERTPILLQRHSWPAMKTAIRGWVSGTAGRRQAGRPDGRTEPQQPATIRCGLRTSAGS